MAPNPIFLIPLLKCYLEISIGFWGSVLFLKLDITDFDHSCNSKVKSMSNSQSTKVLTSYFLVPLSLTLIAFHDDDGDDNGGDFDSGDN